MTHPTLGYTNFRFDGDDAVHMAAFNGAGHVIACNAEGPTEHDLWPHGVDAPVDCESCVRARLADWWMARAEQIRRDGGDPSWPEPHGLDSAELPAVAERLVSQVDAHVEAAILWGDGDNAPPIAVEVSNDYHFAQDKAVIRVRQGDNKAYRTVDHASEYGPEEMDEAVTATLHKLDRERAPESDEASPSVVHDADAMQLLAERLKNPVQDVLQAVVVNVPRMLGDHLAQRQDDAKLARYLARSPLSYLASDAGKSGAPEEVLFGSTSMLPPVGDFAGRRLGLSPEEEAEGPDFTDGVVESSNWCHVHNRTTEASREECSKCDGERDEDRKAGES